MLIVTAVTTGKMLTRITPPATLRASAKHPARRMIGMSKCPCEKCANKFQFNTDQVAACNCCDDGEFFTPIEDDEQYLAECGITDPKALK